MKRFLWFATGLLFILFTSAYLVVALKEGFSEIRVQRIIASIFFAAAGFCLIIRLNSTIAKVSDFVGGLTLELYILAVVLLLASLGVLKVLPFF